MPTSTRVLVLAWLAFGGCASPRGGSLSGVDAAGDAAALDDSRTGRADGSPGADGNGSSVLDTGGTTDGDVPAPAADAPAPATMDASTLPADAPAPPPPDSAPAVCGDGTVTSPEACDQGPMNGTQLGRCNPRCSGLVTQKRIRITPMMFAGNLGGVAGADAKCAAAFGSTYKALIADGVVRVATIQQASDPINKEGIAAREPVDWVLKPWTRYVNSRDQLVWITDHDAMLGVEGGKFRASLLAKMNPDTFFFSWAGVFADWYSWRENCQRWTSNDASKFGAVFSNDVTTRIFGDDFTIGISTCDDQLHLACAEQ